MDATRPVPDGAPDGRSGPGRGRTQPDGPGRGRTGARRRTGPPTGAGPEARPAGRHSPDGARRGPDRVKTSPGQTARAPDRTSARGHLMGGILCESRSLPFGAVLARFGARCGATACRRNFDKFVAHAPVFSRCSAVPAADCQCQMGCPRFAALLLLLPHAGTPLSLKNT